MNLTFYLVIVQDNLKRVGGNYTEETIDLLGKTVLLNKEIAQKFYGTIGQKQQILFDFKGHENKNQKKE